MDITNLILKHNWEEIANQKKIIFPLFTGNSITKLPIIFFERGKYDSLGQVVNCCHGHVSNINVEFSNDLQYISNKNRILDFHIIPNHQAHGVVTYICPLDNFCRNSFVSTGDLSGCIVCFLIFGDKVLFIHEGGEGTSTVQPETKNEISSRCYDIWRAICKILNRIHYFNAGGDISITGEPAIDWLIQRIESIDEFVFGSIMYKSEKNALTQGLSKKQKITFLNYDADNSAIDPKAQMLCIAQRNYIGFCTMCWDHSNKNKKPQGTIIETSDMTKQFYDVMDLNID